MKKIILLITTIMVIFIGITIRYMNENHHLKDAIAGITHATYTLEVESDDWQIDNGFYIKSDKLTSFACENIYYVGENTFDNQEVSIDIIELTEFKGDINEVSLAYTGFTYKPSANVIMIGSTSHFKPHGHTPTDLQLRITITPTDTHEASEVMIEEYTIKLIPIGHQ